MSRFEDRRLELDVDDELGLDALYEEELRPQDVVADTEDAEEKLLWDDSGESQKPDAREKDVFEIEPDAVELSMDSNSDYDLAAEPPIVSLVRSISKHPLYRQVVQEQEAELKWKLKREMKEEALRRIEVSARSTRDYEQVIILWDQRDASAGRDQRNHEELRATSPADWESDPSDANDVNMIFPEWMNDPTFRQLKRGSFLDALFDCPYEMHELTEKNYLRRPVMELKEEHKEILYFLYLRLYKPQELADLRGQTDRNIRKVRDVVLRKVRRKVYASLQRRQASGITLTNTELKFLRDCTPDGVLSKPKEE